MSDLNAKPLTAKQIERQKKQVAKDLRKKNYADLLIQGTNNSSIASKRSVENLYSSVLNDEISQEWFKFFVKKPQRRSPVINRGYWIRMESINRSILKIMEHPSYKNCEFSIISLGCGFDPLPFKLLTQESLSNSKLSFLDFDYPELISNKVKMIQSSQEILSVIGDLEPTNIEGVQLKTSKYAAIGCNLRDEALFNKQLDQLGSNHPNKVKIFVAEVSLAYMLPEYANPIIKNTGSYEHSHFIILEQLAPAGPHHPFASTMLYHFNRLEHPLKCVLKYPTISDQISRFKEYFPTVEGRDLLGNWNLVPSSTRARIDTVEAFDEWEEFIMYTQHYIVLHATTSDILIYPVVKECNPNQGLKVDEIIKVKILDIEDKELLERKFSAGTILNNEILINSGLAYNRLNSSLSLSSSTEQPVFQKHDLPNRMCHTLTSTSSTEAILIGGRSAPNKLFSDCYKLSSSDTYQWTKISDLPSARARHSTIKLNNTCDLLIYGGLPKSSEEPAFIRYDSAHDKFHAIETNLENKTGSAVCYDGEYGIIIGGLDNNDVVDDSIYKFSYENGKVVSGKLFSHPLLQRYGSKATFISAHEVILVGGVNQRFPLDQHNSIVVLDLIKKEIALVKIDDQTWEKFPMLVGFDLINYSKSTKLCVGGGAVCFGFGSSWNHVLAIDLGAGEDIKLNVNKESIVACKS